MGSFVLRMTIKASFYYIEKLLIHEKKRKEISESVLIDHLAPHSSTLQPLDLVNLVENYDESKLSLTGLIA